LLELCNVGEASVFLNIEIIRDRNNRSLYLKQTKYTQDILAKYNKQSLKPVCTPAEAGLKLNKNEEQASNSKIKLF
jgi:hypothetical protein